MTEVLAYGPAAAPASTAGTTTMVTAAAVSGAGSGSTGTAAVPASTTLQTASILLSTPRTGSSTTVTATPSARGVAASHVVQPKVVTVGTGVVGGRTFTRVRNQHPVGEVVTTELATTLGQGLTGGW
jgi:hypothetical protein